jgi:hypothetical protein
MKSVNIFSFFALISGFTGSAWNINEITAAKKKNNKGRLISTSFDLSITSLLYVKKIMIAARQKAAWVKVVEKVTNPRKIMISISNIFCIFKGN